MRLSVTLLALGLHPAIAHGDSATCLQDAGGPVRDHIRASFGLPVFHGETATSDGLIEMCRDHYCALFNADTRGPVWVVERLTPEIMAGERSRPSENWKEDHPNVGGIVPPVRDSDYTNSGFNRGHMAASDDFECSEDWMRQTFRFSNAVPQVGTGFNGWVWKYLEERVRNLADNRSEVFVITGPVHLPDDGSPATIPSEENACGGALALAGKADLGKASICDANDNDTSAECDLGIAVPAGLFKVIYVPSTERSFGFLMTNEDHHKFEKSAATDKYLKRWQVSLGVIEGLTSVELFPNFEARRKNIATNRCTQPRWR